MNIDEINFDQCPGLLKLVATVPIQKNFWYYLNENKNKVYAIRYDYSGSVILYWSCNLQEFILSANCGREIMIWEGSCVQDFLEDAPESIQEFFLFHLNIIT